LVLGLVSPLAGLALAVASIHAHFSSVAYLDALPTLFTALAVVLYERGHKKRAWFWLSGICLGIAVAGKYPFALVGAVMLLHAVSIHPRRAADLARWGVLAVAVFFVLNPYLWPDLVGRLAGQLRYHAEYTQRPVVHHHALAPAQQMLNPRDHLEHLFDPGTNFTLPTAVDRTLFALAVPGLALLLKRRSIYGWWFAFGFAFLVLWPSQWVQHKMVIMVPFSVAASVGLKELGHGFLRLTQHVRR
jgi:4-amino-4-deoxy-L-arabinose transferase-like glycosyltransferase